MTGILRFSHFIYLFFTLSIEACDMFGLISISDSTISSHLSSYDTATLKKNIYSDSTIHFNHVSDAFVFLGRRSEPSANTDGYGLAFYEKRTGAILATSNLHHQVGLGTYFAVHSDTSLSTWEKPMFNAFNAIKQSDSGVSIVLGHARTATGGIGNHPFWFHLDINGDGTSDKTFTFEHNGDCSPLKPMILSYLLSFDSTWFHKHPLNWVSKIPDNDTLNAQYIIDTELLFHFIMANIIEYNGHIETGIANALQKLGAFNTSFYHIINFILSDGYTLYAYKITGAESGYNLEYKLIGESAVLVKTGQELSFTDIPYQNLLVVTKTGSVSLLDIRSLGTIQNNVHYFNMDKNRAEKSSPKILFSLSGRKISTISLPFTRNSDYKNISSGPLLLFSGSGTVSNIFNLK